MTLVFRFCYMSSVRSTSDGRGPVTRKRVPDREEPGKPRKDARRGRCHLLEAGLWSLWMPPLLRYPSHQVTKSPAGTRTSAYTALLAHIRMPQFPARSLCKLRVVRPLRAAPATCAWCDKEEPQHPSFLLMTMPGWTFINVYAHDRDPHDPAIEGLQGG